MQKFKFLLSTLFALLGVKLAYSEDILMITMGGTKSHKIPFWELAKGLIPRGHRITFLSGFIADFHMDDLHEVTPSLFVNYIENYTNWDLVGARYAGKAPITLWQALRYPAEACNSLLSDAATTELLTQKFHLAIIDGAFPECALGIVHRLAVPFIYINTVGFYTGSLALAGNPIAYAVTPHVFTSLTHSMDFLQRVQNCVTHVLASCAHKYYTGQVHAVLQQHLTPSMPHPYELSRNVSFILQNGHSAVTYPRAFYPHVAEIACIHCRPAVSLPTELEQFMSTAPAGVIFFSLGSSVRAANMPEEFRKMLANVFARLPQYHVLWKWEGNVSQMSDMAPNVRLSAWLPQQDVLGHRKLKAFITHGGLLSMYEAIYHAVPMVMLPVFCDHDVNAAKAAADKYVVKLPLESITADKLLHAVNEVLHNGAYRRAIRLRRKLLLDQMATPLETAIFWTEYILRHKDTQHLQALERNMGFLVYYSLDVFAFFSCSLLAILLIMRCICRHINCCIRSLKLKRD